MSEEPDPQLPPRLVQELKALQRATVPPALDASILLRGHATIARHRRRRRALQWAGAAASLAAVIAVMALVLQDRHASNVQPIAAISEDLDGNGRVDILDAFWLARRVEARQSQPAWDISGDGKVDQADIDTIAASAVRVGGKS